MPFDAMRQHQKKIQLPLLVITIIAFVFLFGAGSRGLTSLFSGSEPRTQGRELLRLGYDLQSARFLAPPDRKAIEAWAEGEARPLKLPKDEHEERVAELVRQETDSYYRSAAARRYFVPVKLAGEMGIRVTDAELNERIRTLFKRNWKTETFSVKDYHDDLSGWGLSVQRYEELFRGQMMVEKVESLLGMIAGASESEQFATYARDKQRVRVQYCQRKPEEFIAGVKVLPGEKPEEKKADEKKAGEKKGDEKKSPDAEAPEEKKADGEKEKKDEVGVLYAAGIEKRFEEHCEELKEEHKYKQDDPGFEWPEKLLDRYPSLFSESKAKIEYLVALNKDFERRVKVTREEIKDYYDNNPKEFEEKPKKDAPPETKPAPKPLKKVSREIEKKLREKKAAEAAGKAVEEAVKEYNALAPDKRPALRTLAGKHLLSWRHAGPAALDELEENEHFKKLIPSLHTLFEKEKRKQLGEKLTDRRRMDEDRGYLAIRLVEFQPMKMLGFKEARANYTYRLKYLEAWKLAEKAIDEDLKALEEGTLDPKRVRESILLGPGDETCQRVSVGRGGEDLAVGQASRTYIYKQPLGPDAEKLEQEKAAEEKEGAKKKKKSMARRTAEAINRDRRRGGGVFLGWRVIVLVERRTPDLREFRADRNWKKFWKPSSPMEAYYMRMITRKAPGDSEWRETFIGSLYAEEFRKLNEAP